MKHTIISTFISVLMVVLINSGVWAISETPEIARELREIGTRFDAETMVRTAKLYKTYSKKYGLSSNAGLVVETDLSYGKHKLQKLDVFAPEGAKKMPVFLFIHGGGFVSGDKKHVHNVARWAARNNMVGVSINYRLAPEVKWPAALEDTASAVSWVKENIARLGGNPKKVFIGGVSAGSTNAAEYIFREEFQIPNDGIIGAVIVSPPKTDLVAIGDNLNPKKGGKYYGENGDRVAQSAIFAVPGRKVPVLIAYSEYEPDPVPQQTFALIEALMRRDGHLPHISSIPGHNHVSITSHIGTEDRSLSNDILQFMFTVMERD